MVNIVAPLDLVFQLEIVLLDIFASDRLQVLLRRISQREIYALLVDIALRVQQSQFFAPQVHLIHLKENPFYQIVSSAPLDLTARQQDSLPRQVPVPKVSFVQEAINSNSKIYVPSDSIAQLAHRISYHVVAQTSIKTCKAKQHALLLVPRDISAQIVKGLSVSHRKVNCHSIVMALRKLQSIAVSELIIQ